MVAKLAFGRGGHALQWYLPGTDWQALPFPDAPAAPAPGALSDGPHDLSAIPQEAPPLFHGGAVRHGVENGVNAGMTGHVFDVVGGWNSVKNIALSSRISQHLVLNGFVHADVALANAPLPGDPIVPFAERGYLAGSQPGSVVHIMGAKRGNISTADLPDLVVIEMLSNSASWGNEFRIATGAGHDRVFLRGLDLHERQAAGDATYADFAGTSGVWNTSGAWTRSFTDLGDGSDWFEGHGSADTVTGGAGDDRAEGGDGDDTWVLSGDRAGYALVLAPGRASITDIDPSDGDDGHDTISGFEQLRFADGSTLAIPPADFLPANALEAIGLAQPGLRLVASQTDSAPGLRMGHAATALGDVNGDGLADLLLDGLAPRVVFGTAATGVLDLDGPGAPGGFAIQLDRGPFLPAPGAVAPAGDVNGDGLADLVVTQGRQAGVVLFGKAGDATVDAGLVAAGAGGGFAMFTPGTVFGCVGLGDVNADGLDDLAVNASTGTVSGTFVVFGRAGTGPVSLEAIAAGDTSLGYLAVASDPGRVIDTLASAGDVNGDGVPDMLLAGNSPIDISGAYVVFGGAGGVPVRLAELGQEATPRGFQIADNWAGLGWPFGPPVVSAAGDVNGDGLDDLILGVQRPEDPEFGPPGYAIVLFGKADGAAVNPWEVLAGDRALGFIIHGGSGDQAGTAVAAAGDVNGDGLADLLVGAPGHASRGGLHSGAAFLVFGKADAAPVDLAVPAPGVLRFEGRPGIGERGESAGWSVAGLGDVNGDGLADLLVGAPDHHASGPGIHGAVYVIHGQAEWLA